jgi:site-specific DNA-methyltransferase (adenine-specific)
MTIHHEDSSVTLHHGDCLEVLKSLPDNSVDSVVTDPPYGLEFMGKDWDAPWKAAGDVVADPADVGGFQDGNGGNPYSRSRIRYGREGVAMVGFQEWCTLWATECLRVLKPGGHILAFGGSRTWHRLVAAIEDAGFEIRDSIAWLYGSGFPKSLDVSKAIDKAAGAEREVIGKSNRHGGGIVGNGSSYEISPDVPDITAPATDSAKAWAGWGTALKPAFEPIVVGRKPLSGTVAANVLAHGTGALNIDACRIGDEVRAFDERVDVRAGSQSIGSFSGTVPAKTVTGRWPANAVLDEAAAATLPGGAAQFFSIFRYTAKAPSSERPSVDGVQHATVKPLELMRWLVRLVTPPDGVVLEPFAGSGTTVEACLREGKRCIAIERETSYLPLILARISDTQLGFDLGA